MSKLIYEFYGPEGTVKEKNIGAGPRYILNEAEKYGIEWRVLPCTHLIELTYKGKKQVFHHQIPTATSALSLYVCNNKKITTNLLFNNNISVPKGYIVKKTTSDEDLLNFYKDLQKPLVVKPGDGIHGKNITTDITDYDEYIEALTVALNYSEKKNSTVIVEEMFKGSEYRVLATKEKILGVLNRRPASVLGNGLDSIRKLIKEKNTDPLRTSKSYTRSHNEIIMDNNMSKLLSKKDMDFNTIPKKDERIYLRQVSNISQGGDAIDFTDKVHESVKKIALKAINTIPGSVFTGIDFISTDITKKQTKDSYVIIEINNSPGFVMHDYPYEGKNRHIVRDFLFLMFPELKDVPR